MQPYQERVVKEKEELDDKLKKLISFIDTDTFKNLAREDKLLLKDQHDAMMDYSAILGERIQRFNQ